jgi:stage II sporulation protein D
MCGLAGCALCAPKNQAAAQPLPPRSVRVRLFASQRVVKAAISGVTVDASLRTVVQGNSSSPLGPGVLEFSDASPLAVFVNFSDGTSNARGYQGIIFVAPREGELLLVNRVDMESYVASVLSAEVSPGWPYQSLRAQAIATRTFAARAVMSARTDDYDLTDDTSSQVYPGSESIADPFTASARDTAGKVLTFAGVPASVFYSSSCGGHTASSEELTGAIAPVYLNGVSDNDRGGRAYCSISPYFRWTNSVTNEAVARVVAVAPDDLRSVSVTERWPDGRVKTLEVSGAAASLTLSGRDFYKRALGVLGYKVVPSTLFDINRQGANFVLIGHGVGHGVGMCQWGARGRAQAGMSGEQILQAYFPGTTIA